MSMKKKFLALALAGMVAMPVVANATANQEIVMDKYDSRETNVTLTGDVRSDTGAVAAGKIQVEIPSAVTFSIDQDGGFTAPNNFIINNKGLEAIKVEVVDFIEESAKDGSDAGIEINEFSSFNPSGKKRNQIALKLIGSDDSTHAADLSQVKSGTDVTLFENIAGGRSETIRLAGKVGQETGLSNGASEDFTLRLKISKGV